MMKLVLFAALFIFSTASAEPTPSFSLVLFICIWKRPLLTEFVLSHYDNLRNSLVTDSIYLNLFIVGSENTSTALIANRFSASFAVHPNSPLGAKHNMGIQSLREHFLKDYAEKGSSSRLPDAVAIFGSDDIVNRAFFVAVRDLMDPVTVPRSHMVGLRDIFFYDLKTRQLVYTKGYRSFQTGISGTLGCGRVYSWSLLEVLEWQLWDSDRQHGLDQSATRNVMRKVPMIEEVTVALSGRELGILAIDIKSDSYSSGSNIWKFSEVVEAVGKNGRFHDFEYEDERVIQQSYGVSVADQLDYLRRRMEESNTD